MTEKRILRIVFVRIFGHEEVNSKYRAIYQQKSILKLETYQRARIKPLLIARDLRAETILAVFWSHIC